MLQMNREKAAVVVAAATENRWELGADHLAGLTATLSAMPIVISAGAEDGGGIESLMERRLIDANELMGGFNVRKVTEYDESGYGMEYKAVPVEVIEKATTIDAEPVVRCKDCVYSNPIQSDNFQITALHCSQHRGYECCELSVISPNNFCAAGTRKMNKEVQ